MPLTIAKHFQEIIQKELASLPAIHGKVIVTFQFNCTIAKAVGTMKVFKTTEEEIRS